MSCASIGVIDTQDYSPTSKCDGAADRHHGGGFFSFLNLWTNKKFLPSQVPNLGPHKKGTRQQPPKIKSKYFFSDPQLSPLLHQKSKKNKKLDFSRSPRPAKNETVEFHQHCVKSWCIYVRMLVSSCSNQSIFSPFSSSCQFFACLFLPNYII